MTVGRWIQIGNASWSVFELMEGGGTRRPRDVDGEPRERAPFSTWSRLGLVLSPLQE